MVKPLHCFCISLFYKIILLKNVEMIDIFFKFKAKSVKFKSIHTINISTGHNLATTTTTRKQVTTQICAQLSL